jgi:hypothetical protein
MVERDNMSGKSEVSRPTSMSGADLTLMREDVNKFVDEFLNTQFDAIDRRSGRLDQFVSTDESKSAMKDQQLPKDKRESAKAVFRNTEALSDMHWDWSGNSSKVSKEDLQELKTQFDKAVNEIEHREQVMAALERHKDAIVNPDGQKLKDTRLTKAKLNAYLKSPGDELSAEDEAFLKEIQKNFDSIAGWDVKFIPLWDPVPEFRHQPSGPLSPLVGDGFIDQASIRAYLDEPKNTHRKALETAGKLWDDIPNKSILPKMTLKK